MKYTDKDIEKFSICTKLISRGCIGSSSYNYSLLPITNLTVYDVTDIVGISVNGNRKNRLLPDYELIKTAMNVNVKFVTDNPYHRNRYYNIGEREVAEFLRSYDYIETSDIVRSIWTR